MALQAPVPKFSPGYLVSFNGKGQYLVLSVTNEIGFSLYNVLETNSDEERTGSVLNLEKINTEILHDKEDEQPENEEG